jgi:hypothetical protein
VHVSAGIPQETHRKAENLAGSQEKDRGPRKTGMVSLSGSGQEYVVATKSLHISNKFYFNPTLKFFFSPGNYFFQKYCDIS